jgi:hypothetical protein
MVSERPHIIKSFDVEKLAATGKDGLVVGLEAQHDPTE